MNKKGPRYRPVHERVLSRTKIPLDKTKCWTWTGPVNNAGFGMIKGDSSLGDPKMVTVHRVIARHYGMAIEGTEVQHTCLNKVCVNPKHLTLGKPIDRHKRIVAKHGKNFQKPKIPYKQCEHCGRSAHIVWFKRKHGNCYPGMLDDYQKFICDKV